MLVNEGIEDLFAQTGRLVLVGTGPVSRRCTLQSAFDRDGIAQDVQLQTEVPVPSVMALQGEKTQLTHRKTEIFEFLNIKPRARRNCTGHEPGEHDEVAASGEPKLDAISRSELLH
ncbi:MAG TPA: hypothetical protein VGG09_01870 [Acidimicrobiales bacterium]